MLYALSDGAPRPAAPLIGSSEIVTKEATVELRELVAVNGNVSLPELAVLASLVRIREPQRIFEFGTFDGRSTVNMAVNATAQTLVFTLDLPAELASATALSLDADDLQYIVKAGSARASGTQMLPVPSSSSTATPRPSTSARTTRALNDLRRDDPRVANLKRVIDTSFGYLAVD
jgi:hypothetical protein